MPKKGTKPKTTPVPSPLPSENPATQTRGRPPRSAKAKAAAAWQPLATTRKRMQADVLADAADAPVAPKPKRVRPDTQSGDTVAPDSAPGTTDTAGPQPPEPESKSGAVPPRLRYRAPHINIEDEDIHDIGQGRQDDMDIQHPPRPHTPHHRPGTKPYEARVAENAPAKNHEPKETSRMESAHDAEIRSSEGSEDLSDEYRSNPPSDDEEQEKDDAALIELEGDAQALAHQFSQETPRWVDSESKNPSARPTRKQSDKKASSTKTPAASNEPSHGSKGHPSKASYSSTRAHELVKFKEEQEGQTCRGTTQATPGRGLPHRAIGSRRTYESDDDGSLSAKHEEGKPSDPKDSIDIVWPEKGGKIGLKAQHSRVQSVAHRAIDGLLARVCLENAFPEGPEKHSRFAKQALIESAEALGFDDIVQRLKHDREYAKALATIPAQRLSTFRGRIKTITDTLVQTVYGLESGNRELVGWLKDSLRYIYPGDFKKDTVEAQKPFSPPIFVQVLRTAFFNSGRSIGTVLSERFSSSEPGRPDEKELPAPMLALVSTAIFASIADYEFDVYDAAEFSADAFADVYAENMRLLEHIKARGPKKYHALMHRLYLNIRGLSTETKMRPRISSPLAVLNLDDMDE